MKLRTLKKSQELSKRAEDVIAHGALTNSKRPQSFVRGVYPTHLTNGLGAIVWDVDGNEYVDYICGLGAQLFGYSKKQIINSVHEQIYRGSVFSLGSELEVRVAEKFREKFSYLEQIRFLKTGSEACSAAIRIARVYTGRLSILSQGYSGWHDAFTSLTPPANGVPPHHHIHRFQDVGMVSELTAAVVVEPVITDMSDSRMIWLRELKEQCKKAGALLIFDETISGIRFPKLSVAKYTGIDPDISIMGKAIGGGYPLSLVGGRRDVMSCDYFVSSTFAGDCVALAAAEAVLKLIDEPEVIDQLHVKAEAFCKAFNAIEPDLMSIEGYNTRGVFKGAELNKALFMQECVKAGVLFGPSFLYGTEHHKHDDHTLGICRTVLNRIKNKEVKLEGEMPVKPYAQKVRE